MLFAVIPMAVVTGVLGHIFNKTNRELKRLDNASRSPAMTHLAATVEGKFIYYYIAVILLAICSYRIINTIGLSTVHAFNKVDQQIAM